MSDVFYKATRMSGGSFHDPTVVYQVGKRVRPKPYDGERTLCGPGVLHASRRPEDAVKFVPSSEDFRLFTLTGNPIEEQSDKAGFKQVWVIGEVPWHEAFGPNGVQVVAALDRIRVLTDDELDLLADWDRDRAWDPAWVRAAARAAARERAWVRAAARERAWVRSAARDRAWIRAAARVRAWAADYVAAVAIQDLIGDIYTQADHDLLVEAWETVIGVWDGNTFVKDGAE